MFLFAPLFSQGCFSSSQEDYVQPVRGGVYNGIFSFFEKGSSIVFPFVYKKKIFSKGSARMHKDGFFLEYWIN